MIIAVTNLKGGVGKSTLSRNLAVHYAKNGFKTCIVDTDIEQRTTVEWRVRREGQADYPVDVYAMSSLDGLTTDLKTHLKNDYQIIIIDGAPQLHEVTTKMLLAASMVIVPIGPSIDDLKSFEHFVRRFINVTDIRGEFPAFIVLNRYGGTGEGKQMHRALEQYAKYGFTLANTKIGERVAHKRSSKLGLTALEWDDRKARREIEHLCTEIETSISALQKAS
jgi:chromosome partitioning protein